MGKVRVFANRGASAYEPENTTAAIRKAIALRADGIVLNVHLSKDGIPVVICDASLDRVPNGKGCVADCTLQELKRLNVGKKDTFDFMQIPTLEDAYRILAPSKLAINIELMTRVYPYPGIEEKVLELEQSYGLEGRVIYSSFNHESLINIRSLKPDAKTGLLFSDGWYHIFDYARNTIGTNELHIPLDLVRREGFVDAAHEEGFAVAVQDVEESSEIRECLAHGVDILITGRPDLCRVIIADMI